MGSYRFGALLQVYIPYRSSIEALYTLNPPPVVFWNKDVLVRHTLKVGVQNPYTMNSYMVYEPEP